MHKSFKQRTFLIALTSIIIGTVSLGDLQTMGKVEPIVTNNSSEVINTDLCTEGEGNCVRQGTAISVRNPKDQTKVEGVINYNKNIFAKHEDAISATMKIIQKVINYALGILAAIALVYALYQGFLMITAGNNDGKISKGKKGIKSGVIAIIGIGLSWAFISLVIRFVKIISE